MTLVRDRWLGGSVTFARRGVSHAPCREALPGVLASASLLEACATLQETATAFGGVFTAKTESDNHIAT